MNIEKFLQKTFVFAYGISRDSHIFYLLNFKSQRNVGIKQRYFKISFNFNVGFQVHKMSSKCTKMILFLYRRRVSESYSR